MNACIKSIGGSWKPNIVEFSWPALIIIINPQRMHEGCGSRFVCVCHQASCYIPRLRVQSAVSWGSLWRSNRMYCVDFAEIIRQFWCHLQMLSFSTFPQVITAWLAYKWNTVYAHTMLYGITISACMRGVVVRIGNRYWRVTKLNTIH